MHGTEAYDLPDYGRLVLSFTPSSLKPRLDPLLRLHHYLARVVNLSKDIMLIQLRLAWWRDELRKAQNPQSAAPVDPLLGRLIEGWRPHFDGPIGIIDAWEGLLGDRPWPDTVVDTLCLAYGKAFASMAGTKEADAAHTHGRCWACAELRLAGYENALGQLPRLPKLSRNLRSLALIGGLSRRALSRPEMALLGDRLSPLAAMRLGLFGR